MCYYANTLYVKTAHLSIPVLQIFLDSVQIRHQNPTVVRKKIRRIQFFVKKTFSSTILRPFPEPPQISKCQIIEFISSRKINQQERNPLLLFKLSHKPHLMLMDIGKGKDCFFALFRIEAYRNPLHCPDIIHRTFLFKIRQGDLSGILGDPNRRDRCRHFLNQCQPLFTVLLIAPVDQFFKCRTPESS